LEKCGTGVSPVIMRWVRNLNFNPGVDVQVIFAGFSIFK
jgi:hypothetical protein